MVALCGVGITAHSQNLLTFLRGTPDTNYIVSFQEYITGRVYASVKYTNFKIHDGKYDDQLFYKSNRRLIYGIGATYGAFTLNLGIPLPWVSSNKDDDIYGTSDYLDLQSHLYWGRINADLTLQFYKGYYLSNPLDVINDWQSEDKYPLRGDIRNISLGTDIVYVFNSDRYSYRATFNQNEWQKKSAGSFLAGVNIYSLFTRADSSMIPADVKYPDFFENFHFDKSNLFAIGPTVGYAHNFVVFQHVFLMFHWTGSATAGFTHLISQENGSADKSGFSWNFASNFRFGTGYNSNLWFAGLTYLNIAWRNQTTADRGWLVFNTGNFRFNIVRRFKYKTPQQLFEELNIKL
jgi:hypothetical protein